MKAIATLLLLSVFSGHVWAQTKTAPAEKAAAAPSAIVFAAPSEFKDQLTQQGGVLIDVRTPQEYSRGHLANAKLITLNELDFRQQISSLDKTQPVFLYCSLGTRSSKAASIMREEGFTKVYTLKGAYRDLVQLGIEEQK